MGKEIDLVDQNLDQALELIAERTGSSEERMNNIQKAQALAMISQTWVLLRILEKLDGED